MEVYWLGRTTVHVYDEYLETIFEDGTKVPAAGNDDPESVALAAELGYASTWEMTKDHEFAHTWLATLRGYDYSPTLWRVAHGEALDRDDVRQEEQAVLDWQRAYPKHRVRPWEWYAVHPPTQES